MGSQSDKGFKLLNWCAQNKIEIDPRLAFVEDPTSGDVSVHNASDEFILDSTILVTIPKSTILSIRTCSLSRTLINAIESRGIGTPPYGHEAKLTLALVLYSELLSRSTSHWADYLRSLPQQTVPIALFWGYRYEDGPAPAVDSLEAKALTAGTEIERGFKNEETSGDILAEIHEFYESLVRPLLSCHSAVTETELSLKAFHYAYSLVSSRAFLVDAYHGLGMVPIADAFNHGQENHVHLESDFDVCTTCGSVNECEHDLAGSKLVRQKALLVCGDYGSEEDDEDGNSASGDSYGHDTCEMVTNRVIPPGSEVFNTYGEELSNAELLVQYGFMMEEDGNENDAVIFDYQEVVASMMESRRPVVEREVIDKCITKWGYESGWEEGTQQVYNVRPGWREEEEVMGVKREVKMRINVEGKMSHDLWMTCALCCRAANRGEEGGGTDVERLVSEMKRIASRQIRMEGGAVDGWGHTSRDLDICCYGTCGDPAGKQGRDFAEEGQGISSMEAPQQSSSSSSLSSSVSATEQAGKPSEDDDAVIVEIRKILGELCVWRKKTMERVEWGDQEEEGGRGMNGEELRKKAMIQLMTERRILEMACTWQDVECPAWYQS